MPATSISFGKGQGISKVFANGGAQRELCIKGQLG